MTCTSAHTAFVAAAPKKPKRPFRLTCSPKGVPIAHREAEPFLHRFAIDHLTSDRQEYKKKKKNTEGVYFAEGSPLASGYMKKKLYKPTNLNIIRQRKSSVTIEHYQFRNYLIWIVMLVHQCICRSSVWIVLDIANI